MPASEKPLELSEDTVASFHLSKVSEELMKEEAFRKSGRVARTLVRSDSMTAVVTAIEEGGEIHEHATDAPILVTVLSGHVVVSAGLSDTALSLPAGSAAVLGAACPHRLKATERSTFLLVMGGRV